MSKIFYDHLLVLDKIEVEIKKAASSKEEREELWQIVDEIIHHRVLGCVLDKLPYPHHKEFLELFYKHLHDEGLFGYLKEKTGKDFKAIIKKEIRNLRKELADNFLLFNSNEMDPFLHHFQKSL